MPETIPAFSDGIMVLLLGEAYFTRSRLDQCLGASIEYSAPSERQAIANQSCSRAKLALLFLPRQAAQRCRHGDAAGAGESFEIGFDLIKLVKVIHHQAV